jgi:hypothetical protein
VRIEGGKAWCAERCSYREHLAEFGVTPLTRLPKAKLRGQKWREDGEVDGLRRYRVVKNLRRLGADRKYRARDDSVTLYESAVLVCPECKTEQNILLPPPRPTR